MKNKLAIVIPYYKIDFFEETIRSVASQKDKNFSLYIGNDNSPDDPLPIIKKYLKDDEYKYFYYEENLGGKNLALQWERILENVKEEWFQILGDDDNLEPNFVQVFYDNYDKLKIINLVKYKSIIVDDNNNITHNLTKNLKTGEYSSAEFFIWKLEGKVNSSLSEHLFRTIELKKIGFKKYPLAWHSDDYATLEITSAKNFFFISNSKVIIKEYKGSISGSKKYRHLKNNASKSFNEDLLRIFSKKWISKEYKDFYLNFYLNKYPELNKKKLFKKFYGFWGYYKLFAFYSKRIIGKKNKQLSQIYNDCLYSYLKKFDKTVVQQRKDPLTIPVIIINFNQLEYLKQMVNFLQRKKMQNIIIIDNLSTYPPLLEYYDEIKDLITIEYMRENYGYQVFFKNNYLQKKYSKGYYIITDPDIIPNSLIPDNFVETMIYYLDKYFHKITKVGLAIDYQNLPSYFALKKKVEKWELQFWKQEIEKDVYLAQIDTTFALYKPKYKRRFNNLSFLTAIRLGGVFIAKHGGWFVDNDNLTDEQIYYRNTANASSSWLQDQDGNNSYEKYKNL